MKHLILFVILSLPVLFISWKTLLAPRSHGFYRFFSWECIIGLITFNYKFWFEEPFSLQQVFSWLFLFISVWLVVAGIVRLRTAKKSLNRPDDKNLYEFEKTTELIDSGIFHYIRHPMYASLLLLTWGIFLKNITGFTFLLAGASSLFLYLTALADERECISYFGDTYLKYMQRTKRLIPFVF